VPRGKTFSTCIFSTCIFSACIFSTCLSCAALPFLSKKKEKLLTVPHARNPICFLVRLPRSGTVEKDLQAKLAWARKTVKAWQLEAKEEARQEQLRQERVRRRDDVASMLSGGRSEVGRRRRAEEAEGAVGRTVDLSAAVSVLPVAATRQSR
jgi:hypothetical protein